MYSEESVFEQIRNYPQDCYRLFIFTQKLILIVNLALKNYDMDFYEDQLRKQQLEPKYIWLREKIKSIIRKKPIMNYLTILDKESGKLECGRRFTWKDSSFEWVEQFINGLNIDTEDFIYYHQIVEDYKYHGVGPEQDITINSLITEPYARLVGYARYCFSRGISEFGWCSEYPLDKNEIIELESINRILVKAERIGKDDNTTNNNQEEVNDSRMLEEGKTQECPNENALIVPEELHPIKNFIDRDSHFRSEFLNSSEIVSLLDNKIKTYWNELEIARNNNMYNTVAIFSFSIIDALLRIALLSKYPDGKYTDGKDNLILGTKGITSECLLQKAKEEGIYTKKYELLVRFMQENRNSLHLDSEKDISTKNDADIIYSTLKEICENVEKFIKNQAKSIPK
ncbi:hypothetical protein [Synechococcus sp. C9]|uniref:hypothetical protein n=1 Tax=Synechococcus sp. C9 TaxID=102119 RepID=UPI001FF37787|nr:hypothetical protein [Synechococcus sp. C9]